MVIKDLFNSKKVLIFLFGVSIALVCKLVLNIDSQTVFTLVILPTMSVVVSQGITDFGKPAAIITAAAQVETAQAHINLGRELADREQAR